MKIYLNKFEESIEFNFKSFGSMGTFGFILLRGRVDPMIIGIGHETQIY